MKHIKLLLCVLCAIVCLSASSAVVSAETDGVAAAAHQANAGAQASELAFMPHRATGQYSPMVRIAACTAPGARCNSSANCCSGRCSKDKSGVGECEK